VAERGLHALRHALAISGTMTWEILWALILGFGLSAVVQAVVRRSAIVGLLGGGSPQALAIGAGLGADVLTGPPASWIREAAPPCSRYRPRPSASSFPAG
jgi:uncharacterized membrane protein YraQ (UPF0718 family)